MEGELPYDHIGFNELLLFGFYIDVEIGVECVELADFYFGEKLLYFFENNAIGIGLADGGVAADDQNF